MGYKRAMLLPLATLVTVFGPAEAHQEAASNLGGKQLQAPAASVPQAQPNPIFSEILPALRQKTRVPLRLPAYVPFSEHKPENELKKSEGEENLYATIVEANDQGYAIQLAFGRDCAGAHVCRDGGLTGSTVFRDDYPDRPKIPVKLRGGIRGYFVDSECAAYCDESILYWSEKGYHYSISSKAASKDELARIANSAIDVAQAQSGGAPRKTPNGSKLLMSEQ